MISNVKFNELTNRVDLLVEKVLHLEAKVKSLTDSQGGEIPPRYDPGNYAGGAVRYFH